MQRRVAPRPSSRTSLAVDADGARLVVDEAEEREHQRRLAGARPADDADALACAPMARREAVECERQAGAVAHADALELDRCRPWATPAGGRVAPSCGCDVAPAAAQGTRAAARRPSSTGASARRARR